ncbi:hypothetical protein Bca52824_010886 [Brassica carinata]|uniref:Uncharacterized protein n=1 Tax=Brassica carinata TaxID=52824 RepID=A0A8X7WC88_BRACI|nr:hypothetical protein Bca52824_010886 [Brassica carinata]
MSSPRLEAGQPQFDRNCRHPENKEYNKKRSLTLKERQFDFNAVEAGINRRRRPSTTTGSHSSIV